MEETSSSSSCVRNWVGFLSRRSGELGERRSWVTVWVPGRSWSWLDASRRNKGIPDNFFLKGGVDRDRSCVLLLSLGVGEKGLSQPSLPPLGWRL